VCGTLLFLAAVRLRGADASSASASNPAGLQFFEKKIRPILADKCYQCHSLQAEKLKAGLLLDSREDLMRGGDTGPVIVAGEPENSRLIAAIRHLDEDLKMPPKEKLSVQQITDFETWVKMGAPAPSRPEGAAKGQANSPSARKLWAFQPVKDQPIPKVKDKAKGGSRLLCSRPARGEKFQTCFGRG
jgi:hypothetical protein